MCYLAKFHCGYLGLYPARESWAYFRIPHPEERGKHLSTNFHLPLLKSCSMSVNLSISRLSWTDANMRSKQGSLTAERKRIGLSSGVWSVGDLGSLSCNVMQKGLVCVICQWPGHPRFEVLMFSLLLCSNCFQIHNSLWTRDLTFSFFYWVPVGSEII